MSHKSPISNVAFLIPPIVGVMLYFQVLHHDYIHFDDALYTYNNSYVSSGLSWDNVCWAFSDFRIANYHPLTLISHSLDFELFGNSPGVFAFVNVLFHAVNSFFLLILFRCLGVSKTNAILLSIVFVCHPVLVEGVAWISQRKSVMASFFFLPSVILYIKVLKNESVINKRFYLSLSVLMYVFSLLSKATYVTMPLLLVFVEYIVNDGFEMRSDDRFRRIGHLILRLIPYVVFSFVICILTYFAQVDDGAVSNVNEVSVFERIQCVIYGYFWHFVHFIYPDNLSIIYPFIRGVSIYLTMFQAMVLVLVSFLVFKYRKISCGKVMIGWLFFLFSLVPMIGFISIGWHMYADRYMYGPIIGLLLMLSGVMESIVSKYTGLRVTFWFRIGFGLWVLFLAVLCYFHIGTWKSSSLIVYNAYSNGIRHELVDLKLVSDLLEKGEYGVAKEICENGIENGYLNGLFLHYLAVCELNLNNLDKAIEWQERYVSATNDRRQSGLPFLARLYFESGRIEEAIAVFDHAAALNSSDPADVAIMESLREGIQRHREMRDDP